MVLVWLSGTWLLFGGIEKIREETSRRESIQKNGDSVTHKASKSPKNGAGSFAFAPIKDPEIAHLVAHLRPDMTLLEIEGHVISLLAHNDRQQFAQVANEAVAA